MAFLFLLPFVSLSAVLGFSELYFVGEPHDVTVRHRDSLLLDCQARGEAPITNQWLKNGVKIQKNPRVALLSNGSLYIRLVGNRREDSDEGGYQCLAQNRYGAILSHKAQLTVARIDFFSTQPSDTTAREGSVTRLTCQTNGSPTPRVTWELNQTVLLVVSERMTLLPSGVLQINDVQLTDGGRYRCVATNMAGQRTSTEATLTVTPAAGLRLPQVPQIIAGPQNLMVPLHQPAVLECLATGHPKPLVSWSRADHKPMDVFHTKVLGNGNLFITSVKPEHRGVYACRATTPGTRNFTVAAANLTVLALPWFVEFAESVTRPRAGTARFNCQAGGVPAPRITWLKNGGLVHANGRIKIYNSKLVINQIVPEDDAIYQCLAENSQGSVLSTARLIVVTSEDQPSAPSNIHAETVSCSAILLSWDRPLYNGQRVIAYSVHYMNAEGMNNEEYQVVIGNDTTRYIIEELDAGHNYTFYVVAYMPIGASRMSDHVVQRTLEDIPLRAPELSLTSCSPSDIQVSWQPLPVKLSRGKISAYRLSLRTATDRVVTVAELPGSCTHHALQGLQPDTLYLLRIAAGTQVGWGEPSAWSSHHTPSVSSTNVPLAPVLQLEAIDCTTITLRWQASAGDTSAILGYRLFYREESESYRAPVELQAQEYQRSISGLDPRKRYCVKLLAYNTNGDGYQAEQTASTPGCVSVRDRLVPLPLPPHQLHAHTNGSYAVHLRWKRPAVTEGHTARYTVRYNPVGLQNASSVLYLQTSQQNLLIQGLKPNSRYEFAVRLHINQVVSPWSSIIQQSTLPEAPTRPPSGVKVMLIESDMALVSWKQPEEPNVAVTHYTILYASRTAWVAGEWHMVHREASNTVALLENLKPGNVYLVRISASNQVGDGPFSSEVELPVLPWGQSSGAMDGSTLNRDYFFHMDQTSLMAIMVGVSISLVCILICALIFIYSGKSSKSFEPNMEGQRDRAGMKEQGSAAIFKPGGHFIDAKGGTDLIINGSGPVRPGGERKAKCWFFSRKTKEQAHRKDYSRCSYHLAPTMLRYQQGSTLEPFPEYSHSNEGSQSAGDSGHYSQDGGDVANMQDVQSEPLVGGVGGAMMTAKDPHLYDLA